MSFPLSSPVLGIVWGVLKYAIGVPIINKALDHWVAGTSNRIDDMVWAWIESMAGIPEAERPTVIAKSLWELQRTYNEIKKDGGLDVMKSAVKRWDSAALVKSVFPSGNIA